jgi:O-antigen/teichoic acid export membrane protein
VPGLIAVCVVALLFMRFAWHLPGPTRNRLIVAAVVYFVGALGVEALSGWRAETMGYNNMTHSLIATAEEVMELTGIAMVIVALLRHMQAHGMALTLSADEPGAK